MCFLDQSARGTSTKFAALTSQAPLSASSVMPEPTQLTTLAF